MEFWLILGVIVIIFLIIRENMAEKDEQKVKTVKKQLGIDDTCTIYKGEIVGGDHPVVGTTKRKIDLAVTMDSLIIVDNSNAVKISLPHVRANVADQSAVSALGILAFGLVGLGAREKLLVLEIDDPVSKEKYRSVFRIDFPNAIADLINKQRYDLLCSSDPTTN
jgi:hypothetical protein